MTNKTFRGLIADGVQDTIVLHTNNGAIGYRIVKFEIMSNEPGEQHSEHTFKIYSIPQTTIDNTIDFSDQTLLASGYMMDDTANKYPFSSTLFFDNMIFNQDIYITMVDTVGSQPGNYYIELEQVKLDLNENTVATLKDIRNITTPT